jgi:hypothetical protein
LPKTLLCSLEIQNNGSGYIDVKIRNAISSSMTIPDQDYDAGAPRIVAVIGFAPEPIESGTAYDEPTQTGAIVLCIVASHLCLA